MRQRGTSVSSISARSYDTPSEASLTYAGRAGKKNGEKKVTKFFNLVTFFFLSYKRNYLEIFMLPTLNPPPPPWAWVTFPAAFQLPRHSECQQPDPRSSMRHFRTFPSHGITAEDSPVSRMRRFAHETTLEDPFVSRTRRLAHETSLADLFVSRMRRLAQETTSEGHSVSRTRRLAHETTSEDPSREQNAPSRSRDNLGRPSREQNAAFRSRDNLGRHRQAPSCTNPISWPLWYTRQAPPVPKTLTQSL